MNSHLNYLSTLKLSGMHESIEYRLMEATQSNQSYEDFLDVLLEDEIIFRKNRKCERLRKRAKFRDKFYLEDFDPSTKRGITKATVKQLEGLGFLEKNQNLLFIGGTGAGKSFLAQAIGHQSCREGFECYFISVNLLFEEISAFRASGKYLNYLAKLKKAKVLILDDFGLRNYTHTEANYLYEILEDRYKKGPVIITSQVRPLGWRSLFEDEVIADAIIDRLCSCAYELEIKGPSYRKNHSPKDKMN